MTGHNARRARVQYGPAVTKTEFGERVAKLCGLPAWQGLAAVNALFGGDRFDAADPGLIGEALAAGESVELAGFGVWRVRERAPRRILHILTRRPIGLPASRDVVWIPSGPLRSRVEQAG